LFPNYEYTHPLMNLNCPDIHIAPSKEILNDEIVQSCWKYYVVLSVENLKLMKYIILLFLIS